MVGRGLVTCMPDHRLLQPFFHLFVYSTTSCVESMFFYKYCRLMRPGSSIQCPESIVMRYLTSYIFRNLLSTTVDIINPVYKHTWYALCVGENCRKYVHIIQIQGETPMLISLDEESNEPHETMTVTAQRDGINREHVPTIIHCE